MTTPLDMLRSVVDSWLGKQDGRSTKDHSLQDWPTFLERVFPRQWPDVPLSPLSSNGSPIQLSVDTARPNELRLVIELSSFLAGDPHAIATLMGQLPPDQVRMLSEVMRLVGGAVPRFGIGLRIHKKRVCWKTYVGSESPGDFRPWIDSFQRNGMLPHDRARPSIALCEQIARSAIMRGLSFTFVNDKLHVSSIYYRSLVPYHQADVIALFRTANLCEASLTPVAMADALGFCEGTGRGCFGYMVGLRPDGGVDNLKVEFWKIPWLEGHQLSLAPLEHLGITGLKSAELLGRTIGDVRESEYAVTPEVISSRSTAPMSSSVAVYFALPRDGHA